MVDIATTGHLNLKPLGHGVHALRAHAVGAAGEFVTALAVFAAGVQGGEHHLDAGNAVFGMNVDGDAAAIIANGDRAVHVDGNVDLVAMAGEMLVDGVVQDLGNAVMERPFIRAADIHAGLFTHGFQAFEFAQLGGVVVAFDGYILRRGNRVGRVGHVNMGTRENLRSLSHR